MTTVQIGTTVIYAHDIVSARIHEEKGIPVFMVDAIGDGDGDIAAAMRVHSVGCKSYEEARQMLEQIRGIMESVQPYVLIDEDDKEEGVYDDGR